MKKAIVECLIANFFTFTLFLFHIILYKNLFLCRFAFDFFADFTTNKFDADVVVCAFGNDDVGVAFRRFDKLEVHRANGCKILRDDRFDRSAAL